MYPRYQPFYTAYYTQIPYLDSEINNIEGLRYNESRLRNHRVARTVEGLAATNRIANVLSGEIARSRRDDVVQDRQLAEGLAWGTRAAIIRG